MVFLYNIKVNLGLECAKLKQLICAKFFKINCGRGCK